MSCAPGMNRCRLGCAHRAFVLAYRAERERQLIAAENASKGHATERAEHLAAHPLITYAEWMRQHDATAQRIETAA